jgi:hypothetical protein
MSGYPEETILKQIGLPREVVLIRKPFSIEELAQGMEQALDRLVPAAS